MFTDIINGIINNLRTHGVTPVYSAFDAVDTTNKSKELSTIVGIGAFSCEKPIYSQYSIYFPFKAEIDIKITASEKYSLAQIYSYYDEKLEPVISDMSGLTCVLSGLSAKFDTNIQRLVLNIRLDANGISKFERSST
ncbi:MAG: hypothetical protein K6G33_11330 [Ruminococcus sp.]|uniref:hypothetical protein n=1 Tax=Ruminococcus sp. TaxID=41978 RepID=UPI0025FAC8A7|nr:hypothetical protein [Ruminococcus sp.]MCR5601316.1 hypothetical protein [Ruminococcus sp.]